MGIVEVDVAGRDQAVGPGRGDEAFRRPIVRRHAVHQRADANHDEIDDAEREEGLYHTGRAGRRLEAGDGEAGHDLAAAHQQVGKRGTDHRATAEAHDGHAGRHAAPVGKPFDQRRDRRDVAQAKAHATEHAEAEVEQPELVQVHRERAEHEAAAPAEGGDEGRLARAGALEPAAEQRGRDAEEDDAGLEGLDGDRVRPVAGR